MGRRIWPKLLLLLALAALTVVGRRLAAEQALRRSGSVRVEPLVSDATRAKMRVAALILRHGDGRELLFARSGGIWRCRELWGAVADWSAIQSLADLLMNAEGVLQSDVPERFGDYGIGVDRTWHLSLHGPGLLKQPDRDTLLEIELGDPLFSLDGCYVHLAGEQAVRVIDQDPLRILLPPGSSPDATPLLDAQLVSSAWLQPGDRIRRVQVQRVDGVEYTLALREASDAPPPAPGAPSPLEWVLEHEDGSVELPSLEHATAYTVFLGMCHWSRLVDPARGKQLGLDKLVGRLVLGSQRSGEMLLGFGPQSADGLVPVANDWARNLYALSPEVAKLCLPAPDELLDPAGKNPWEPWLIAASQAALARR